MENLFEIIKWYSIPGVALIPGIVALGKNHLKMTSCEKFWYMWFLFNGALIHIFLDGLIGALGKCKPIY
jgi:hypothetical protein